jgi:membrane protein implicated in regulation of membrane protease activity
VTDWIIWIAGGLGLLILEMLLPGVFMMWLGLAA